MDGTNDSLRRNGTLREGHLPAPSQKVVTVFDHPCESRASAAPRLRSQIVTSRLKLAESARESWSQSVITRPVEVTFTACDPTGTRARRRSSPDRRGDDPA